MEETCSKLNSTQNIVVNLLHSLVQLLQQLVAECTGWYWLHSLCTAYPTPPPPPPPPPPNWLQSHPTQSIQLCVDSRTGRQQVSANMASIDWLQSFQITRPVYRLYSLIFTKTGYRVITSTTGYRAYRHGTGYTPKPVT